MKVAWYNSVLTIVFWEYYIDSHYLPSNILEWVTLENMPINALDEFIEARIELIIDELRKLLEGIEFDVIDTKNLDK